MCWPQCSDTTLCNFILKPIQTVCFDLIFNLHGLKWVWPVLHMHSWCPIGAHEPLKVVRECSTWKVECAILGTFLDIMLWTMAWAAWYITNILSILEIWVALFHFKDSTLVVCKTQQSFIILQGHTANSVVSSYTETQKWIRQCGLDFEVNTHNMGSCTLICHIWQLMCSWSHSSGKPSLPPLVSISLVNK